MPRRAKPKMSAPSKYAMVYTIFLILELIYVFLLWSPYGKPDGMLHDMYQRIRNNLNLFVAFNTIYIVVYSFIFPGIGWLAFIITLWRVADLCCNKENFGDGLHYGWGRYYPDCATFFNQAHLEREQDGTRAAYSSAVGDNEDSYWLSQLSDYENKNAHRTIHVMCRKKLVFEKNGCGYGKWIIPEIKDKSIAACGYYLCDGGCDKCKIQKYGNIFEMLNEPRPLYTTSLLAKEMNSS